MQVVHIYIYLQQAHHVVGRVLMGGRGESGGLEVRRCRRYGACVRDSPRPQQEQLIERREELKRRLVDGRDDVEIIEWMETSRLPCLMCG